VPFRQAYVDAKQKLDELEDVDPAESLAQRVSPGACADLQLDRLRQRLEQAQSGAGMRIAID
jgi:argininosuccinate lyase